MPLSTRDRFMYVARLFWPVLLSSLSCQVSGSLTGAGGGAGQATVSPPGIHPASKYNDVGPSKLHEISPSSNEVPIVFNFCLWR